MKNPKAKGSRLERIVKEIKEKEGFLSIKSGASLTNWDLVCIPRLKTNLIPCVIQVKSNRISKQEMRRLADDDIKARKEIWIKPDYKNWIIYVYDDINCEWKKIV